MSWRVHLANQAIQQLYVIPAKLPTLAVWTRHDLVHFYELEAGKLLGETKLPPPPQEAFSSPVWQAYLNTLQVLQTGVYLPHVRIKSTDILLSDDGKTRLYFQRGRELIFDDNGMLSALPTPDVKRFLAVEFDRQLANTVAIDSTGKLYLYQQETLLGAFDVGLRVEEEGRALLAISRGGNQIFASDGHRLVVVSPTGKLKKTIETHYDIGRIACSPSGSLLAVSDREAGVLRAYRGDDLTLTHQKFAIELVAQSEKVQLFADLPPINTAISALSAFTQGMIPFAMSGVVCMTDVTYMDELPQKK